MPRSATLSAALPLVSMLSACSGAGPGPAAATRPATAATTCNPDRDRQAIRAMAGGYQVKFEFTETVPLVEGYALKPPYRVGANELVILAENSPDRIVLQHILAIGAGDKRQAMKHWRQDWTFQPTEVLEYRGGELWEKRRLADDERRCAWAQQVYGIEDAPRYGGWGRWLHQGGSSSWTSGDVWRPLPRRESKREDYDILVGSNRHIITPAGWVHEQDNGKLARGRNQMVVRERGLIPYNRASAQDFSAVAGYWRETGSFWREVRLGWQEVIARRDRLSFLPEVKTPQSLNDDLEALREQPASDSAARRQQVIETIEKHLEPAAQRYKLPAQAKHVPDRRSGPGEDISRGRTGPGAVGRGPGRLATSTP
jgi:hypothetical protein